MSTLKATNLQNASSATTNIALDTSGNVTVGSSLTAATNITATSGTVSMASSFLRNRIINGAMVIDQRNAGASVSVSANDTSYYPADRAMVRKNSSATITTQQSTTVPTGFKNSALVTVTVGSAVGAGNYLLIGQNIEGFNVSDWGFGTANAATITVSFWARSSATGTYNFYFGNNADSRYYVTTFTINSANTFEYKTITITGDTAGTWTTDNTSGLKVGVTLGAGTTFQTTANTWASGTYLGTSTATNTFLTAANTFYITGFQVEVGSIATPFERRLYGQELALCQRYYETNFPSGTAPGATDSTNPTYLFMDGLATQTHTGQQYVQYKVVKRASATVTIYSISNGASGVLYDYNGTTNRTAATQFAGPWSFIGYSTSLGNANNINMAFNWTAAAEL